MKIRPVIPIPAKNAKGDLTVLLPTCEYTLNFEKEKKDWITFGIKHDGYYSIWNTQKHFWIYQEINFVESK